MLTGDAWDELGGKESLSRACDGIAPLFSAAALSASDVTTGLTGSCSVAFGVILLKEAADAAMAVGNAALCPDADGLLVATRTTAGVGVQLVVETCPLLFFRGDLFA